MKPEKSTDPGSSKKKSHPFWRWFWLSFLVASLAYAWHSFYVPPNDVDWADDIVAARQAASDSERPVLMFFTADWCVPCRMMKRKVFADPEVMTEVNARVIPVMIHAGDPGADEAFERYKVQGTPITILTDSQGVVIDYAVGGIDKSEFLELLDKS
ncbi:thioredoxin family protein [Haloferula sp.]|uniref:thioredoxin family protein n=1 Tax=Haloferula sp. TaxID=2497595 RepID=UPI00329C753A